MDPVFPICQDTVIRIPLGRLILTFRNPLVAEKSLQGMPIFILFDMLGFQNGFPINDHLVSFNGDHLTGIFINKVLDPDYQIPH